MPVCGGLIAFHATAQEFDDPRLSEIIYLVEQLSELLRQAEPSMASRADLYCPPARTAGRAVIQTYYLEFIRGADAASTRQASAAASRLSLVGLCAPVAPPDASLLWRAGGRGLHPRHQAGPGGARASAAAPAAHLPAPCTWAQLQEALLSILTALAEAKKDDDFEVSVRRLALARRRVVCIHAMLVRAGVVTRCLRGMP